MKIVTFSNNFFGPDGNFYRAKSDKGVSIEHEIPEDWTLPRGAKVKGAPEKGAAAETSAVKQSPPTNAKG